VVGAHSMCLNLRNILVLAVGGGARSARLGTALLLGDLNSVPSVATFPAICYIGCTEVWINFLMISKRL